MAKKRPDVLKGQTEKIRTGCGNLYLTLNYEGEEICEVRPILGKSGSCVRSMLEIIGILMSILLQNVGSEIIIKAFKRHLCGVKCDSEFKLGDKRYGSCVDKIGQAVLAGLREE